MRSTPLAVLRLANSAAGARQRNVATHALAHRTLARKAPLTGITSIEARYRVASLAWRALESSGITGRAVSFAVSYARGAQARATALVTLA